MNQYVIEERAVLNVST